MALDIARAGDNSGGLDQAQLIAENLNDRHGSLKARAEELNAGLPNIPDKVDDEEMGDKVSESVRQCREFLKGLESTRVDETEPYLAGQRAVMSWAKGLAKLVQVVMDKGLRVRSDYDIAVENRERERREAEARRAREEADRLAAEAQTRRDADRVEQANQRAEQAYQATKATSADLTRTRTVSGVTTSLKTVWDFEIVDPKQVPKQFMVPSEALIRAKVKASVTPDNKCPIEIKGVRIFERKFSQVR